MNRKTWTILLGVVMAALRSSHVQAQTYDPGPLPTIGDIQTMCVEEYPAPQTRTDVGIGEQVSCWIDTSTWQDTDICHDGERQYNVSDSLGTITWDVSGPGSVYPTVGDSTTLTIDLLDADDVVTVIAMAYDSGTLGVDPPVQKQKVLNAKIPTGIVIQKTTDNPSAAWKPGNANFGAETAISFQVQPNTVNLKNVNFQVVFGGNPNFVWPDGTKAPVPSSTWGPWNTSQTVGGDTTNLKDDRMSDGLRQITLLAGQNTQFTNAGSLQYQDKAGAWKGVNSYSRLAKYQGATNPSPPPAAAQTQLGASAAVGSGDPVTKWGGWQGPWQ